MESAFQENMFSDDGDKQFDFFPDKTIRIAVSGDVIINDIERQIIDTPAFQRLRRIKQLGTSYLVYPSAMHSRFEHSLGTLHIADIMVQKIRESVKIQERKTKTEGFPTINNYDRLLIRLLALLHDISQVPFGHTLEDELHVLDKDHDSDDKRFEFFLGDKTNKNAIAGIIHNRIGEDGYNLFLKLMKAKKVKKREGDIEVKSLGEKAYICDIVKNTVCADLLDYLRRDAYYCNLKLDYGDRFLNFLYLASVNYSTNDEKGNEKRETSTRLAIRVWKEKEKTHRRDIIDELINLLNCRFFLGSAVYYHHAKLITSAMIARAIKQALDSGTLEIEKLWTMGDDELLYHLANQEKDKLAKKLVTSVLNRNLYDDFFEFSRPEAEAVEEIKSLDNFKEKLHNDIKNRIKEENRLSEVYKEGKAGDVLIYCPDPDMSMKEAEMMVLWKKEPIPLRYIEDKLAREKINNIIESHKKQWKLKIFISPELRKVLNENSKEAILTEWCKLLVKVGDEAGKQLKCTISMTIVDILEKTGTLDPGISAAVFTELQEVARTHGIYNDGISRKNIEKIISSYMKKNEK